MDQTQCPQPDSPGGSKVPGIKQFESPQYVKMDAQTFVVGIEFPTVEMPDRDEMIEVRLFGGQVHLLVNAAMWGDRPDTEHMLFIQGRRVKL